MGFWSAFACSFVCSVPTYLKTTAVRAELYRIILRVLSVLVTLISVQVSIVLLLLQILKQR